MDNINNTRKHPKTLGNTDNIGNIVTNLNWTIPIPYYKPHMSSGGVYAY